MHSAATADRRTAPEPSLSRGQLRRVARIQAAVSVFYAVDGMFFTALALLGTLPMAFGVSYLGVGWCATGLAVLAFRRGRRRLHDLRTHNFALSIGAAALMLSTALLAPQIGGLMLMSLMTVLTAAALQLATRPLLGLWLVVAGGTAAALLATGDAFQLPMSTPAHRLLCAAWFAWLLGKCGLINLEGTRLRREVGDANTNLVQALGELRKLATTDELTVIANRRSIVSDLDGALAAGAGPVAVALFDIDHFKRVNDRFGHAAGDLVLREFAALVSRGLRPTDRVGRYGGEEFLLVLPEVGTAASARETADRMRRAVEAFDWDAVVPGLRVTASAGVALIGRGESAAEAIARADRALYAAKAGGRNRVVLAGADGSVPAPAPLEASESGADGAA